MVFREIGRAHWPAVKGGGNIVKSVSRSRENKWVLTAQLRFPRSKKRKNVINYDLIKSCLWIYQLFDMMFFGRLNHSKQVNGWFLWHKSQKHNDVGISVKNCFFLVQHYQSNNMIGLFRLLPITNDCSLHIWELNAPGHQGSCPLPLFSFSHSTEKFTKCQKWLRSLYWYNTMYIEKVA